MSTRFAPRVDALAGSLRDLHGQVQALQHLEAEPGAAEPERATAASERARALDEARELVAVLAKDLERGPGEGHAHVPSYAERRAQRLSEVMSAARSTVAELEQAPSPAAGADGTKRLVALSLRTKVDKARLSAFELETHLEEKAHDATRDQEHYRALAAKVGAMDAALARLDTGGTRAEHEHELTALEGSIVPLTQQTPYTLLMMRVVEIGLPVLLALLSLFFVLRYTLTERRCLEIETLLAERHAGAAQGGATPTGV